MAIRPFPIAHPRRIAIRPYAKAFSVFNGKWNYEYIKSLFEIKSDPSSFK
jgi:hypothetical protein